MGNLVKWPLDVKEASWDEVKIERSTSESGVYSEIASQSASDNTYYDETGGSTNWYQVRYYNSVSTNYGDYSTPMSALALVVYYCNATDVARILQVDEFGGEGATKPSLDDIEEWILEAQDDIDSTTHNAWRSKTVTDEYHDINQLSYEYGVGWPIYLMHRNIKTLSTSEGDKIEVWDGESWVDWIASSDYSEGRDEDYWVDYKTGILYIVNSVYSFLRKGVRVTHRYGNSSVPKDIRDACAMMVAIKVLETNDRTIVIPEGELTVSYSSRIRRMQDKIDTILNKHSEVQFPLGD